MPCHNQIAEALCYRIRFSIISSIITFQIIRTSDNCQLCCFYSHLATGKITIRMSVY